MISIFDGAQKHLKHHFKVARSTLNAEIHGQNPVYGGRKHLKAMFLTSLRWLYPPPLKISTKGFSEQSRFTGIPDGEVPNA